jgi:hypothetical protein
LLLVAIMLVTVTVPIFHLPMSIGLEGFVGAGFLEHVSLHLVCLLLLTDSLERLAHFRVQAGAGLSFFGFSVSIGIWLVHSPSSPFIGIIQPLLPAIEGAMVVMMFFSFISLLLELCPEKNREECRSSGHF